MRMALSTLSQVVGSIILIAIVQQYFLIAVAVVFIIYFVLLCQRCEALGQRTPLIIVCPLWRIVIGLGYT
jgi:hypothetical protein